MSCCSRLITNIDIFGQGIQLRIDNQIKSRTLLGGLLSLIMIIALTTMFFISANDVLNNENPQIITEALIVSPVPPVRMNFTTLPIGISLTNDGNAPLDLPRYFDYEVHLFSGMTAEDLKDEKLEMVKCTKDMFPKVSAEKYEGLTMDDRMCIKDQDITLYGSWGDLEISFLRIIMFLCRNTEEEPDKCAPLTEVEDFLRDNDSFMNLYVMDTIYNPKNHSIPITFGLLNLYKKVKFGSAKLAEIYIKNQTLDTDDGLIFGNKGLQSGVSVEKTDFDDGAFNPANNRIVMFDIYASNTRYTIFRRYSKIQEVLASVGGLANIVIIAFTLICYIFSVVKRDISIQNKIFDYDMSGSIKGRGELKADLEGIFHQSGPDSDRKRSNLFMSGPYPETVNKENNFNDASFASGGGVNNINNVKSIYNPNSICNTPYSNSNIYCDKVKFRSSNSINFSPNNQQREYKVDNPPQLVIDESNTPSSPYLQNRIGNFEMNVKRRNKVFSKKSSLAPPTKKDSLNLIMSNNLGISNDDKSDHSGMQINQSTNNQLNMPMIRPQQKNNFTDPKQILNILTNRKKKFELHFSFCEIVRGFICCEACSNKKIKFKKSLYKKSNFVVDEFLDITNIIQKLDEFEKLKIVILNSEQLALFNFIAKEFISLDEDKISSHYMTKFKQLNKDKEQLANLIIEFKQKFGNDGKEIKEIDNKLYNLLNEEFK